MKSDNVPQIAWEFYIGGYQPAQKWLKDRRGSALNFDDILHYQKMIVALTETDRIMKEIEQIFLNKENPMSTNNVHFRYERDKTVDVFTACT